MELRNNFGKDGVNNYIASEEVYKALSLMEKALKNVSPEYVKYVKADDRTEKFKDQVERCFAYELYHQLRNEVDAHPENYRGIVVNGEIPKVCKGEKFPDLIIHGGQGDDNINRQLLVCEIKRNRNKNRPYKEDIRKDLEKLGEYIETLQLDCSPIGFQTGCFVMVDASQEEVLASTKELLKEKNISIKTDFGEISLESIASKLAIFSYQIVESDNSHTIRSEVKYFLLKRVYDDLREG